MSCQCRMCQLEKETGKTYTSLSAVNRGTGEMNPFTHWMLLDREAIERLITLYEEKYGNIYIFLAEELNHD